MPPQPPTPRASRPSALPSWITHQFTGLVDRKPSPICRHIPDMAKARPPNTQAAPCHCGLELEIGGGIGTSGTPVLRTAGFRYAEARLEVLAHQLQGDKRPPTAPTAKAADAWRRPPHRRRPSWITHSSIVDHTERQAPRRRRDGPGERKSRKKATFEALGPSPIRRRGRHFPPSWITQGRWIGNPAPEAEMFPIYRRPRRQMRRARRVPGALDQEWTPGSACRECSGSEPPVSDTPTPGGVAQLDTIASTSGRVISRASSRVRPGMRSSRS